ncbi:hypothetical protein L5515_009436 [Caenorhabditis briggsae]|uniref:Uncharacterized protein n=1 Tax=Caenorhabditis briggsae TaxID=6238 RepID=A0AAE9JNX0_CAEBR|nr:hypothetical protein L5515_009436 [Caenorhabditis briggsae]
MSHHDELKWVHPDHHDEVMKTSNGGAEPIQVESAIHTSRIEHSTISSHRGSELVYVTFYTYEDRKLVRMVLDERYAFEELLQKANELLPTCR